MVAVMLVLIMFVFTQNAQAARYWVAPSGSGNCGTAVGDEDPGVYLATPTAGVACLSAAGDRLTIKAGTYTGTDARIRNVPSGAAGNPIIIEGDPSDGYLCALESTCQTVIATSSSNIIRANYITVRRISFNAANNKPDYPLHIGGVGGTSGTCTGVTVESVETWNTQVASGSSASGIFEDAGCTGLTIRWHHSHTNGVTSLSTNHGAYLQGDDTLVEYSSFHDNAGLGLQCFASASISDGRADRCTVRYSEFYTNDQLGLALEGHDDQAYGNLVYNNGRGGIFATYGGSARAKIHNNTIIDNNRISAQPGVYVDNSPNSEVMNNIIIGHSAEVTVTASASGTTVSHNACLSSDSCGSTGKVTITSAGQWLVNPVYTGSGDFSLKPGSNDLVGAGTTVSTRPTPVGTPDIGAYERGEISSAAVVSGYIEVTVNVPDPGIDPTTGITAFTIACAGGGCAGTPVVSAAAQKAGSNNIVQLTLSGFSASGTCSASLASTNLTDSIFIGGRPTNVQKVNTVSGLAVTGTCGNTGAPSFPGSPIAHYLLSDGSGTTATDNSGSGNHGTVSSGVTWTSGGVSIPTDATYRHVAAPFGASTNLATTSGTTCAKIIPDSSSAQKVAFSSGSNGAGQRFYFGWATVGGQRQWGLGLQSSGFSTGSEFPVSTQETLVCAVWNSSDSSLTLWVDGVKGSQSGKSVKTHSGFTTTATNFRYGNDGTNTVNNGGFEVTEILFWSSALSDGDMAAVYSALYPTASGSACYRQAAHKWELTTLSGGSPVQYGLDSGSVSVIDNGAVALVVQIDCTGSAGSDIALTFFYSTDGINFDLAIPSSLGSAGISVADMGTNTTTTTCCISGALTANNGPTLLTSSTSPTITLSQNHSYTIRLMLKFGSGLAGQSFWIKAKQDSGAVLAGGYTPSIGARVNVVNPMASGIGF